MVENVRDVMAKQSAKTPALHLYLTGGVATAVDQADQASTSRQLTESLSGLLILLLLLPTYRAPLASPLNLLPPLLVLGLADCLIAESTKIGISVSSVTQAMLTVLILGAGTDAGASRRRRLSRRWRRWRSRSRLWAVPDPAWCARSYVPSTVLLLGRWNWWPSRLAQRHTPEAPVARAAR